MVLEDELAKFLAALPPSATLLMYQGEHVGALQQAGIPLRHVISEVSHPDWEWALLDPAHNADFIIAFKGDPVWMAAHEHRQELTELISITVPGQAKCAIYRPFEPAVKLRRRRRNNAAGVEERWSRSLCYNPRSDDARVLLT